MERFELPSPLAIGEPEGECKGTEARKEARERRGRIRGQRRGEERMKKVAEERMMGRGPGDWGRVRTSPGIMNMLGGLTSPWLKVCGLDDSSSWIQLKLSTIALPIAKASSGSPRPISSPPLRARHFASNLRWSGASLFGGTASEGEGEGCAKWKGVVGSGVEGKNGGGE